MSAICRQLLSLIALLTTAACFVVTPAAAGSIADALPYIEQGQHQQAYRVLEPLAEAGNPEAQYLVGRMIIDRQVDGIDQQQGVRWLERAVENQHPDAAQALSKMYLSGYVVPLDAARGAKYQALANEFRLPGEAVEECD